MSLESKYKVDDKGFYLDPERAKKQARKGRKAKKKTGDRYLYKKVDRLCPKCGKVIKRYKTVKENKQLGIPENMTVLICECGAIWKKYQCKKVTQRLKRNPPKKLTNAEFKRGL